MDAHGLDESAICNIVNYTCPCFMSFTHSLHLDTWTRIGTRLGEAGACNFSQRKGPIRDTHEEVTIRRLTGAFRSTHTDFEHL